MTTNANATAKIVQPQLPPLPPHWLFVPDDGKWKLLTSGTRQECDAYINRPGRDRAYALITVTPPQTPASDEEIRDAYDNDDAACGIRQYTHGYRAAERRLGLRPCLPTRPSKP